MTPSTSATMVAVGLIAAVMLVGFSSTPTPSSATSQDLNDPPTCWVRGDRADLELRISPFDSTSTTLDGHTLKVCYSRPRALGRPIMGRLVPFGSPWRLGANEATILHTPVSIMLGDLHVSPGSYSLHAMPDSAEWGLTVNGNVQRWGVPISPEVLEADLGFAVAPVERLAEPVELFTIRLERNDSKVDLVIEWELTRIRFPIRLGMP